MARSSTGSRTAMLLILLGLLVGAGSWNYRRNLAIEEAEPRPYRGYSMAELEDLRNAYQREVDAQTERYRTAASRKVTVRGGGLVRDQVAEFERVQRISQGKREIASEYARNQVRLDGVNAEISHRAADADLWRVVLRRVTTYP